MLPRRILIIGLSFARAEELFHSEQIRCLH